MPDQKKARFIADFGLSSYDASVLVAEHESADFFETVLAKLANRPRDGKLAANWVINELFGRSTRKAGTSRRRRRRPSSSAASSI